MMIKTCAKIGVQFAEKIEHKWLKIGALLGIIISIFMILSAIYFTPNYFTSNLSPDGILEPSTIYRITIIRLEISIIGVLGLLFSLLFIIKPHLFNMGIHKISHPLKALFIITSFIIILLTCAHILSSCINGSNLNRVSGAWIANAMDLTKGTFYRPLFSEDIGYGGTRYFPLYFTIHALLINTTGNILTSGYILSLSATIMLLLGLFALLRRMELNNFMAVILSLFLLTSFSLQYGLTTIGGDILPVALNVWGLVFCINNNSKNQRIYIGAFFFTLAFAAKVTCVHGALAIFILLLLKRELRRACKFVGILTLGYVIVLMAIYVASDGRFIEIMRVCSSGGTTWYNIVRSPICFVSVLKKDQACLLFFFLALISLITSTNKRYALSSIFLLSTIAVTVFIYGSPGTDANHLVDLHVASILVLGFSIHNENRYKNDFWLYGVLVAGIIGLMSDFNMLKYDLRNSKFQQINAVIECVKSNMEKELLSEDPIVPVAASEQVYLLDTFMFRVMATRSQSITDPLLEKIRKKDFRSIILVNDINHKTHMGHPFHSKRINKAIDHNYFYYKTIGNYFIYLPKEFPSY